MYNCKKHICQCVNNNGVLYFAVWETKNISGSNGNKKLQN